MHLEPSFQRRKQHQRPGWLFYTPASEMQCSFPRQSLTLPGSFGLDLESQAEARPRVLLHWKCRPWEELLGFWVCCFPEVWGLLSNECTAFNIADREPTKNICASEEAPLQENSCSPRAILGFQCSQPTFLPKSPLRKHVVISYLHVSAAIIAVGVMAIVLL